MACSFFGQQFKVKPAMLLHSGTGIKPQRDQERHAGKSSENLISCLLSLPVYIFDLKESQKHLKLLAFLQWNESKPSKVW